MSKKYIFFLIFLIMGCATATNEEGMLMGDDYLHCKYSEDIFTFQNTGTRFPQDFGTELMLYPLAPGALNFLLLRFLWDHEGYPFSGFINTIITPFAILPGYSHTDKRFWSFFNSIGRRPDKKVEPQEKLKNQENCENY